MIRRLAMGSNAVSTVGDLPLSSATVAGPLVFVSGQVPADNSPVVDDEDLAARVRDMLDNLDAVLLHAGSSRQHVVRANVYLTDESHFPVLNREFAAHFAGHLPARTTVCISLFGLLMEIDCIAVTEAEA
jgi:2-iminobutanoate/2-iminopropanoate deaminase